jgi:signal peptidase I
MQIQSQRFLNRAGAGNREVRRAGCELIARTLRAGCGTRIRVTGTSMIPAVRPGDILTVMPCASNVPSAGEIVLFLRYRRLFAHRVVRGAEGVGPPRIITRGDANSDCDPPVSASELLGVVTSIVRDDGTMRNVPVVPPIRHRLVAFAIRHSDLSRRLMLKWQSLSRLPFSQESQCH